MDSGADLLVVGTEQAYEQRLRAFTGERRSLHLRGDEPPYGEAFGSLMRLFRRFQAEVQLRRIHLPRRWVNKGPLLLSGEKSHGPHRTITPYVCMLNMGCGLGAGNDSSFL